MFIRQRTQGLIFKKENRGEADQLFKVYTKDFGKLEILGKGIRKISAKLRSQIEIFYLSEIEFIQGKIYKTLTDALLIEKFENLRKDLKRLALAFKISEVLDDLLKGEGGDERIWDLILETFKNLNNLNFSFSVCNLQYYYFLWNLISYLGYHPEIYSCSKCQKKIKSKRIYFNNEEGGIICFDCFKRIKKGKRIEQRTVKILRVILKRDFNFLRKIKIKKEDLEDLKKISEGYLKFLSEKDYENKIF